MPRKSCLRSPPLSRTPSSTGSTPEYSRSVSPLQDCIHSARKCVSFCKVEEGLEEVFEADEWDRSPAPMTPRLSYQDILELKQLKLHLPNPQPAYRQHYFTTRASSSTSTPAFPVSRLAMAPSLTPSKWKNREEPQCTPIPDPAILPYLDAVPIRLLPLLDLSQSTKSESLTSSSEPSASSSPAESHTMPSVIPDPPPLVPSLTITSSSSPLRPSLPAPPSLSKSSSSPPRRKTNFAFVPLLPVKDEVTPVSQPVRKSTVARKKLNMTFLPLLPVSEPPQPPHEVSTHSPLLNNPELTPTGSTRSLSESDCTPETLSAESEGDQLLKGTRGQLHLLPLFRAPSPSSTPSLSSASDTDTESDAPSTSNPSSPSELATSEMLTAYFASALKASREPNDINPYFPLTTDLDSTLSSTTRVHPSLQRSEHPCIVGDPNITQSNPYPAEAARIECDFRHSLTTKLKAKLQAVPSPSLVPPSPFSLYPPNRLSPAEDIVPRLPTPSTPTNVTAAASPREEPVSVLIPRMKRTPSVSRGKSSLSFTSSITVPMVSPALSTMSGVSSVSDTPELTIERIREMNCGFYGIGAGSGDLLGPSISRKKSRE